MSRRKSRFTKDPRREQESKKYEHPIPSREFILEYLQTQGCPATDQQLVEAFELSPEESEALGFRLKAMMRDGQLMKDRRERYCLLGKLTLIAGRVSGHPDGFGYVIPDDGQEDLLLVEKQMCRVLHGDRVLVRDMGRGKRGKRIAAIHEVVERKNTQLVGRYYEDDGVGFVSADNRRISQDIYIPPEQKNGAKHAQVVLADITTQPNRHTQPIGAVAEILGEHLSPGMEIDIAIRSHDIPHQWPETMVKACAKLPKSVREADLKDRRDLRDLAFVTIDGEDAKDFDDAVYAEAKPKGGWQLRVAIADVSHYVSPDDVFDREAQMRGNSVYFPGRVVPMLPEVLSNGLCSLKPNVDRLTVVCEMHISEQGELASYCFYPAVIHSHARLTYTQVAAALVDKNKGVRKQCKAVLPQLETLYALFKTLLKMRQQRGAIDFDIPETRIVFDKDRKIEKIISVMRNDAHRIIEECMLLANISAARFLAKQSAAAIFRVHDKPKIDKTAELREFLTELGLQLKGGEQPATIEYGRLLADAQHRPDKRLIQTVILRSLSQAQYRVENIGHFGLAYPEYTHFTSPIRRFPDLLVHRAIKHALQTNDAAGFAYDEKEMQGFATQCTETERRADEATWDVIGWLKCEYMQDKLGEEFSGTVASVTSFGLFVELDDVFVEGLVHITSLQPDYYQFDAAKHRLVGERTNKIYRLGDKLRVQVVRVDLDDRKIDFDLVE